MTNEQKVQKVVEAAGECWHHLRAFFDSNEQCGFYKCSKCHKKGVNNPSPTDLNELFRLAEKTVWDFKIRFSRSAIHKKYEVKMWADAYTVEDEVIRLFASTPAEALLNALYEATQ